MKDITVIIPLHTIGYSYDEMLQSAVDNVKSMQYEGNVKLMIVIPEVFDYPVLKGWDNNTDRYVSNPGNTDYCSQINYGVTKVDTEYFTIMEVDDRYNKKWFNMFNNYLDESESISIYIPINVVHNVESDGREFFNHLAWSSGFSDNSYEAEKNIGFITFESLQHTSSFNLTGSIFKTSDWLNYKPSIKVAFNYEYLLRATNKKQKVYVVPKEGYYHEIFRKNSLTDKYLQEIPENETLLWFELAKREYSYDDDRNNDIIRDEKTELK